MKLWKRITDYFKVDYNSSRRNVIFGSIVVVGSIITKPIQQITELFLPKYDPILISLVRRNMPSLIAHDIIGVQPMTAPSNAIFALKAKYIKESMNG